VTKTQWAAAHAVLAESVEERRAVTRGEARGVALLRGLLFTTEGERLVPTYTVKKGKTYRYYTPGRDRNFGAGSSGFGNLPAEPIEDLVVMQVCELLRAPQQVQAVCEQVRQFAPEITEPEVVLPMRRLAGLWSTLFPAEQRRLVQLLIERVLISAEGLEIIWRDAGWQALAEELQPGTIAAELAAEEGMA
jgi:site-specific DNA recombinase